MIAPSVPPKFVVALVLFGPLSLYRAIRYRDVRQFLAEAFFVSSGVQF